PGPSPVFGALPALGARPTSSAPRPGESGNQVTLGGRPFEPAPRNGSAHPGGGRAVPAWSDLTGATGVNGNDSYPPRPTNGQPVNPLPQRRASDGDPAVTGQQPVIPRQLPSGPEVRPYSAPPVSAPPVSGVPVSGQPVSGQPVSAAPVSAQPVSAQPVSGQPGPAAPVAMPPRQVPPAVGAPPAWPPVANPERETAAPPVPERLAAALDMTTELPRVVRPEPAHPPVVPQPRAGQTAPVNRPATPQETANRQRFADETMELPIFRELESAWFRTRKPGPEEAATTTASGAATQQMPIVDAVGQPVQKPAPRTTGNAPMVNTPTAGGAPYDSGPASQGAGRPAFADSAPNRRSGPQSPGWQTAADDGWRAAVAASEVPVAATTETGLPKRTPMAQLVPGAVEKPTTSVQRRTPEGVRGLLSAYHRGVQRGRSNPSDSNPINPEATPGGQQSSQPGSGPAAGSGQKEQEG
ncbi:ATPase, partial [Micromonospora sp. KC721]